jgi:hypothetical protein
MALTRWCLMFWDRAVWAMRSDRCLFLRTICFPSVRADSLVFRLFTSFDYWFRGDLI